jgi:flagellar FliL protein
MSEAEAAMPKKKSKLIWILPLLLVLGGAGAAGYYFFVLKSAPAAEDETSESASGPALYRELRPAFVVNLEGADASRFLQLEVDLMARDQASLDAVQTHNPAIRNNLLMIFGSARYQDLQTRDGKEALQGRVLEEINMILAEREHGLKIEEVYFSSFVMQ